MVEKFKLFYICSICILGLIGGCAKWNVAPKISAETIVNNSIETINRFRQHKDLKQFDRYLGDSYAVIIFPEVVKAGFFYGGEAGNGVLLKQTSPGRWSAPSFVTLGAASFGLQVGIQETAIILIVRNKGALQSVLNHQGKLGADTGASMGLWGVGMEASVTSNLDADIFAFANANVGAYLGLSLEGAIIARRNDLNESVYGKGATPDKILSGAYDNTNHDLLRKVLGKRE